LRIYPVELSRVKLCRLSWPSLQFCSRWSRPRIHNTSHMTRRNSTSLSANCSDSSGLDETVANLLRIQYTPPTQLNSTVELCRRRRCVLGLTRHLQLKTCGALCMSCMHVVYQHVSNVGYMLYNIENRIMKMQMSKMKKEHNIIQ